MAGPKVAQLIADLSGINSVYRFSVQCARNGDVVWRIYDGEAQRDGTVKYRAALAIIKGGRLDVYTGLEPADAETFWWR